MNLTEEEIKAIEGKAEQYARYEDRPNVINKAKYFEYLLKLGATQERLKAKALIEALEEIKNQSSQWDSVTHDAITELAEKAIFDYNKIKQ